jgi:hypothetical protein
MQAVPEKPFVTTRKVLSAEELLQAATLRWKP